METRALLDGDRKMLVLSISRCLIDLWDEFSKNLRAVFTSLLDHLDVIFF